MSRMMTYLRLARLAGAGCLDRLPEMKFLLQHPPRLESADISPTRSAMRRAIDRAAAFLRTQQAHDGSFRGFSLLPGASTSWITAHAAFVLENVPVLTDVCTGAASYLESVVERFDGCGYNERVGMDCDSTAQALLVMQRCGMSPPESCIRRLVAAQRPEGGFPTYPPPGPSSNVPSGWHTAHPDVTAVVVELLHRLGGFEVNTARALEWLTAQAEQGILPSYWWSGTAYSIWVQTKVGFMASHAAEHGLVLLRTLRDLPFSAMALYAALDGAVPRDSTLTGLRAILASQCLDGSWICGPCLRVTDRRCHQAGADRPGALHRDRRRVFSTIHAIAALARALRGGITT